MTIEEFEKRKSIPIAENDYVWYKSLYDDNLFFLNKNGFMNSLQCRFNPKVKATDEEVLLYNLENK